MVLAVMVAFLIFRVYQVVRPQAEEGKDTRYRLPEPEVPSDVPVPGMPPPPPPKPKTEDWSRIWRFNPMVYRRSAAGSRTGDTSDEINLTLLRIREIRPGTWSAEIQSPGRRGWYIEGQPFETFELLDIDPDTGEVTVFSEEHQRSVVLKVQN